MAHEDREKEDGRCFPPEFRTTAAYAVQFFGVEGRNTTLVDPCSGSLHEIAAAGIIGPMRGKRCLACAAGSSWFLVLDDATRECFLTTLFAAPPPPSGESAEPEATVVPLPPMPEDPPHLEFLFNCALSAPSPTAPGCTVVLGLTGERYLRYCRVGEESWSQVDVTFVDEADVFDGAVAFYGGNIYATTSARYTVVVDASAPAPAAPRVERTDVRTPAPRPSDLPIRPYLVTAAAPPDGGEGDLYFVRPYYFGFPNEVVAVDVCRWDPSRRAWREVDSIGDTTLFLGYNCLAVSPATEAGTQPNRIHLLKSHSLDRVKVHTFSLDDRTIWCNSVEMPAEEEHDDGDDDEEYDGDEKTSPAPATKAYWSVPSNCGFKLEPSRQRGSSSDGDEQSRKSIAAPNPGHGPPDYCVPPPRWSSLPTDLLAAHVVTRLSFIDLMHMKCVCKDWSGIPTPIRDANAWPLLVTPGAGNGGSLTVFDPVTKSRYALSVRVPAGATVPDDDDSASLALHCSRDGWLVVSRGHRSFFLVNPFRRGDDGVVALPPVHDLFWFRGVSFRSTPGSPDFMAVIVEGVSGHDTVIIRTWTPGQASWERHGSFYCEVPFRLARHSPLFLDGEFYCLARGGRLGAFDPGAMAWRVLERVAPIVAAWEGGLGEEMMYAFPAEWKGELVAVFKENDVDEGDEPVEVFRLDRAQMAWTKLEDMEGGAVFWDRKQAIVRPLASLAQGSGGNKVYVPTFAETTANGGATASRDCVFYSMEMREYSNGSCCLYGLKEPIDALWLQPNLDAL